MKSARPTETLDLSGLSFRQKGMEKVLTFLEEIKMVENVGGWEMDFEKNELFWTFGTKRIFDLPENYIPDFQNAFGFIKDSDTRTRFKQLMQQAREEGVPFDEEVLIVTPRSREIWVRSVGYPEIPGKHCKKMFGSIHDITQTKLLHEKNNRMTKLYNAIVKLSGQLIHSEVEDMDREIHNALRKMGKLNQAERSFIFQIDHQKKIVSNTFEWCCKGINPDKCRLQDLPFDDFPGWMEHLQKGEFICIDSSKDSKNAQIPKFWPDITTSRKKILAVPLFFGGLLIGFAGFITNQSNIRWDESSIALLKIAADVIAGSISRMNYESSLIQARQEAIAENLAKSEFLVYMGHEIKTRLHEILGFSEIVLTTTKEEKSKQQLQIVAQSGKALLGLFDDLLELSKLELSKEIPLEVTNLRDMVEEIKQVFLPVVEKQHLAIYTSIPGDLPLLLLDQRRLKHALINLVGNAVKFTRRGNITIEGSVVRTVQPSDLCSLNITVADTGIGISEKIKNQIIQFFKRPGTVFTKPGGEVGLGLYILKSIIAIMHGTIELESELGKGSAFTIHLNNVNIADKKLPGREVEEIQNIVFKGQKLLMVDDMIQHFIIAQSLLENTNLNLFHAKSGEEGVKMAKKLAPDLILMDINMPPGIDGYEATRLLKTNNETSQIPVIAYTTNIFDPGMLNYRELFSELLEKTSITRSKLIKVLMKFLHYEQMDEIKPSEINEKETLFSEDTGFLKEVVSSYSERINQLIDIFDIMEIENLIFDLENQNAHAKSTRLKNYIEELKVANENFDFEKLNQLFKSFSQYLIQ
ncbi:MAG TPA: ATP-binding protein [Bacteroidales bacterium]|nr:ATP-binding protein [Bacteroidales bacterium]